MMSRGTELKHQYTICTNDEQLQVAQALHAQAKKQPTNSSCSLVFNYQIPQLWGLQGDSDKRKIAQAYARNVYSTFLVLNFKQSKMTNTYISMHAHFSAGALTSSWKVSVVPSSVNTLQTLGCDRRLMKLRRPNIFLASNRLAIDYALLVSYRNKLNSKSQRLFGCHAPNVQVLSIRATTKSHSNSRMGSRNEATGRVMVVVVVMGVCGCGK